MKQNNYKADFKNPKGKFTKQIKAYYEQDCSTWDYLQSCAFYEEFQNMIDASIKSNNLQHLEILWQALYFYGTNPNFVTDVYTATEFSDLKTLLHVLWGYMNYTVMEDLEPLNFQKLKELGVKNSNSNVLTFISSLITAAINGEIVPCNKKYNQQDIFGQEFYKCVEKAL
jgi:hypothetical protein